MQEGHKQIDTKKITTSPFQAVSLTSQKSQVSKF